MPWGQVSFSSPAGSSRKLQFVPQQPAPPTEALPLLKPCPHEGPTSVIPPGGLSGSRVGWENCKQEA